MMAQMDEKMGTHLIKTTVAQLDQGSYSNSDFVRNTLSRSNRWYNLCTAELGTMQTSECGCTHKPLITDTSLITLEPVAFGLFPDNVAITGATDYINNTPHPKKKKIQKQRGQKNKS